MAFAQSDLRPGRRLGRTPTCTGSRAISRTSGYWYRRAERTPSQAPLDDEWEEIATALLAET